MDYKHLQGDVSSTFVSQNVVMPFMQHASYARDPENPQWKDMTPW